MTRTVNAKVLRATVIGGKDVFPGDKVKLTTGELRRLAANGKVEEVKRGRPAGGKKGKGGKKNGDGQQEPDAAAGAAGADAGAADDAGGGDVDVAADGPADADEPADPADAAGSELLKGAADA